MNAPVAPVRLQPDFAQRPIPEAFLQALAQRFGAQCSTALAVREQHGRDEGAIQAPPPPPPPPPRTPPPTPRPGVRAPGPPRFGGGANGAAGRGPPPGPPRLRPWSLPKARRTCRMR